MSAELVFWVCCGVLAYTLFGYPAAIALCARLRPRPPRSCGGLPTVTVVVVAHDEERRIRARVENLLALDYPRERLEILVCSDGSSDATVAQAGGCGDSRVEVLAFERRRGKAAVLNDAVARARGEIVAFADARQRFEPGCMRELVAPFADPRIGAVSGELCFEAAPGAGSVGSGVGFYWRYEKLIRRSESAVDSCVGATGAIYAIRRELFEPVPDDTILDDVLIPMRVVRSGYRTWFNPAARAYDQVAHTAREEFARKVRTIAGNFQLFARHRWLLNPARNRVWLQTVSHKLLRLFGPLALAGAFAANAFLLASPFYRLTFALQLLLYGAALIEHARARKGKRRGALGALLGTAYAFCVLQAATVVAFIRFAGGSQSVTWTKARA